MGLKFYKQRMKTYEKKIVYLNLGFMLSRVNCANHTIAKNFKSVFIKNVYVYVNTMSSGNF